MPCNLCSSGINITATRINRMDETYACHLLMTDSTFSSGGGRNKHTINGTRFPQYSCVRRFVIRIHTGLFTAMRSAFYECKHIVAHIIMLYTHTLMERQAGRDTWRFEFIQVVQCVSVLSGFKRRLPGA